MKMYVCTPLLAAVTISGCAHGPSPALSTPTPLEVVAGELGDTRFEPSGTLTQVSGYHVQSGNLIGRQGVAGGMVMVTAPDGAVTTFIQRDGHSGMLQIDAAGKRTFTAEAQANLQHDFEAQAAAPAAVQPTPAPGQAYAIDAMVGFTAKALEGREIDPLAYALGQVEWVNLSLRNSLLGSIEMHLAGVFITNEDIPVTGGSGGGRERWEQLLTPLRASYYHDINAGFSIGGDAGGYAARPGFTSVNLITAPTVFKHEIGHNVGGRHCYPDQGDTYKHGFNAGDGFKTNLCGNSRPYYSNPEVTVDGRVMGNAQTADMGRLWREQASRLSSYSPAFKGRRAFMVSRNLDNAAATDVAVEHANGRVGFVALSPEVGPTALKDLEGPALSILTVKLQGKDGLDYPVNLRGIRYVANCSVTAMNSYADCQPPPYGARTLLTVMYFPYDNPELPSGWYNGVLRLKALSHPQPGWAQDMLISIALRK